MIATLSFAQGTLVATLTHGDEIKMYYGTFAFQQAMNDADHGDVINLSGGTFATTNITKAITLRGTGVDVDNPTTFKNRIEISIPSDVTDKLCIEGCRFGSDGIILTGAFANISFIKDDIQHISGCINGLFTNCNISYIDLIKGSSPQILNSYVGTIQNNYTTTAKASFVNCVINNNSLGYARSCFFLNCVFCSAGTYLPESAYVINCVRTTHYVFGNTAESKNCYTAENGWEIFKESNSKNDLTDEAKALYIGDDGTPVGMYGGSLPYNLTPSYPRITKMNVANRTTADGKLSVDIEVSAAK